MEKRWLQQRKNISYEWNCFTDTALDGIGEENGEAAITEYRLHPRSAAVFVGVRRNS